MLGWSIARLHRRARIETSCTASMRTDAAASPAFIGGLGLKQAAVQQVLRGVGASPAFIGGRGLKLGLTEPNHGSDPGIARLHRRARIETGDPRAIAGLVDASPAFIGGRGLKQPGRRRAGRRTPASPAFIGGRGLKLVQQLVDANGLAHRPPSSAGAD